MSSVSAAPPQLRVTVAGNDPATHHLSSDRITIGRADDNDIVVQSMIVSRDHAALELLTGPGLFFLDEPTSGLDPGTETLFMHLNRRHVDRSSGYYARPPDAVRRAPEIVIPDGVLSGQLKQFQQTANQQDQGNNQIKAQFSDTTKNFNINKPFLYDGLLGFLGASDAGSMTCTFDNAWLFIMN